MLKELLNFDGYKTNIKRNIALLNTLIPSNFSAAFYNPQINQLLMLIQQKISNVEMAEQGDAFLWHHILTLFAMPLDDVAVEAQQEQIVIHLLDNFFQYLPDDCEISIKVKAVFFPKLNLFLENTLENDIKLKKLNALECAIGAANSRTQYVTFEKGKKYGKINILHLANEKVRQALLKDFIPATDIPKICVLTENLSEKIANTLCIIESVDIELFQNIQNNINYLLPLRLHEDKTRNSFSTAELNGSIFISDGGNLMDFCEALIHEYYHNELNIFLQYTPLFIAEKNNLYFSPWRTDLRPVGGLFHAIYVFVGVSLFYNKVLKENLYHQSIRSQLVAIMKKVNVAFYQIKDEDLTDEGKELLLKLYEIFQDLALTEDIDLSPDEGLIKAKSFYPEMIKNQLPECLRVLSMSI